nr:hypothetical protein Iba_chr06cCG0050 [Ipomoea batatas]
MDRQCELEFRRDCGYAFSCRSGSLLFEVKPFGSWNSFVRAHAYSWSFGYTDQAPSGGGFCVENWCDRKKRL